MPIVNLFATLLAGMVLWSGPINKPANFAAVTGVLKGKRLPMPGIALPLAILLEIGGAVMFYKVWRLEEPVRDHGLTSFPRTWAFAAASRWSPWMFEYYKEDGA